LGPDWYLFNQGRIVDLTKGAFSQIADLKAGVIKVTLAECDPAS
jgi:rare lipoprotein A (peptidoglycan hydrolase)